MKLGSIVTWLFKPTPPLTPNIAELVAQVTKETIARLPRAPPDGLKLPEATKPPPDPARENWTWEYWQEQRRSLGEFPGWAFCSFPIRTEPSDAGPDRALFMFGLIRGAFGIWQRPHIVCRYDVDSPFDQPEHQENIEILPSVSHLGSGYGLGVFTDLPVAIEAAELAERVHPWQADPVPSPEGMGRTKTAWEATGIRPLEGVHAHSPDTHSTMFHVNGRINLVAGKPERLS